jgi:hypothetical protein
MGIAGSIWISGFVQGLALHYYAVVNLGLTWILGYTFSRILPPSR